MNIGKPMTVKYEEFKRDLANLINNSGLPAFVVEPVLKDYLIEIKDVVKKQYETDKSQYESSLQSNQKTID